MRIVLAIWMCLTAGAVAAEPNEALKAPGVVALMRHALAPGTGDPAGFVPAIAPRNAISMRAAARRRRAPARHCGRRA
ncbi:hypothetical protein ACSSV8_001588 [Roseovarius sp. MBR-79]|jgi:hypothetical protein